MYICKRNEHENFSKMMIEKRPNLFVKDSFEDYKKARGINASKLKSIRKSPLDGFKEFTKEETAAMAFGSLYHKYVLENDDFDNEYFTINESERPDPTKTMAATENKNWKAAQISENAGKLFASTENILQAKFMNESLTQNTNFTSLLDGCETEVSLYLDIELDGLIVPVKCRFDAINVEKGYILDLKTTSDASPFGFSNEAGKFAYHIQAAFYMFLARKMFNKPFKMYFAAQEKSIPFNCAIYNVSEAMRYKGEQEIIPLLIAAFYYDSNKENLTSYTAFCPNENGIFDLDIKDYHAQPREFFIDGKNMRTFA